MFYVKNNSENIVIHYECKISDWRCTYLSTKVDDNKNNNNKFGYEQQFLQKNIIQYVSAILPQGGTTGNRFLMNNKKKITSNLFTNLLYLLETAAICNDRDSVELLKIVS